MSHGKHIHLIEITRKLDGSTGIELQWWLHNIEQKPSLPTCFFLGLLLWVSHLVVVTKLGHHHRCVGDTYNRGFCRSNTGPVYPRGSQGSGRTQPIPFQQSWPGWWLNQPIWKILVKMGIFPNFRGEHKKYLSCHHLVTITRKGGQLIPYIIFHGNLRVPLQCHPLRNGGLKKWEY